MSGGSDLEDVGQQLGASAFLSKPFDVEELLRLVAKFLSEGPPVESVAVIEPAEDRVAGPLAVPEAGTTPA